MKYIKLIFIVSCFLILTQAFGQTTQPTSQSTTQTSEATMPEEVLKKTEVFEIIYPADWELNETGLMGTTFILFSATSSADDAFRENVNYMIQDVSAFDLDLDSFIKLSLDQIKSIIANSQLLSNEKQTDKNGNTFQRIEYTGDQGIYNLHFMQHIYVENGQAQIITFTAEQDQYSEYKNLAESIISTIVRK